MQVMTSIACYVRVSSKGQDYATQRDALARALPAGSAGVPTHPQITGAASGGGGDTHTLFRQNFSASTPDTAKAGAPPAIEAPTVVWYEEKLSAKTNDRPELNRLLADLKAGKHSSLYVFKLDRLCRTGVADTFRVVELVREARVTLHAVADNLVLRPDREDITSEVLIFALGLAAKLERTARNDRIAAARTRIEAKGGRWGHPVSTSKAQDRKCAELADAGRTVREIAMALGIKRSTVARAIVRARAASTAAPVPAAASAEVG